MSGDDAKPEDAPEGFSPGTIIFAFSLFGFCILLLAPGVYKQMTAVPEVRTGPESGEATHYTVGTTSCGTELSDNDFVAAIGKKYWTKSATKMDPLCQTQIKVRLAAPSSGEKKKSKSVTVLVQDRCAKCKPNDIQLSPAAFQKLGLDLSVLSAPVTWDFVGATE